MFDNADSKWVMSLVPIGVAARGWQNRSPTSFPAGMVELIHHFSDQGG